MTIGDLHTVGPCRKAVFACLATDVKFYLYLYPTAICIKMASLCSVATADFPHASWSFNIASSKILLLVRTGIWL